MAKKKNTETKNEQLNNDNDLLLNQPDGTKFLITDGTIGIYSDHGLVDIRNGSLKISTSFSGISEIGDKYGMFPSLLSENTISIKDGILNPSPSLTFDQSIIKANVDNRLVSLDDENIYTSVVKDAVFDIYSQPMFLGIDDNTLKIKDAAFTIFPNSINNTLTIKDGVFSFLNESKSSLRKGAGVINSTSLNENILTVRDGTLIPNPSITLLTGENTFLSFDSIQGGLAIKDEPFRLTTGYLGVSDIVIQTQKILSEIDWLNAGNGIGVDLLDQSRIQEGFLGLSNSYSSLFLAAEPIQPPIVLLPKLITEISSIEYLQSANLLSQVT